MRMEVGGRQVAAPTREFGRCALGFVGAVINRPHGGVLRIRTGAMWDGRLCGAGGRLPPLRILSLVIVGRGFTPAG